MVNNLLGLTVLQLVRCLFSYHFSRHLNTASNPLWSFYSKHNIHILVRQVIVIPHLFYLSLYNVPKLMKIDGMIQDEIE